MTNQLVSVIVTTKNEERNIGRCLESVKNQSYSNIEIIVVDNDSSDKTKKIAKKYTGKVYDLKSEVDLKNVVSYRGAQMNFGVSKCNGKLIFFPDADMTFDKNLIGEAVQKLDKIDAFFIPEIIRGKGFFGKIRNFERSFYNQTCIDGVRIVKKELYYKIGGFDEKNIMFGPDDWDFTKRIKINSRKTGITKSVLYHHEEALTIKSYIRKKKKYVHTFDGYIKKWGKNDPDIKKQLGAYYRMIGVFVENGKWKKLISSPILSIGMYFVRFLVAINYLFTR
ncbi:MAG: glycosyltransferase [archaeon]